MGLPCRIPTYKEVENKINFYDDIPAEVFQDTKTKLSKYLKDNNKIVMRDYCHWTGKSRGAGHQHCNIRYRKTYKIPCFFNEHIRIQDSLQFLNCSLDILVSNLKDKGLKENKSLKDTFPTMYSYFKKKWSHLDEDVFELLCRKGVYPCEYFDTF